MNDMEAVEFEKLKTELNAVKVKNSELTWEFNVGEKRIEMLQAALVKARTEIDTINALFRRLKTTLGI